MQYATIMIIQAYIPTPYLAVFFYLAYSNYKKFWLKSSFLPDFADWLARKRFSKCN
jgi:hypothetical protein